MISLGFSTADLAKYNSATIYKSVLNGIDVSSENKNALSSTYSGLNAFTSNPQAALTWGSFLNSSSYDEIVSLFKAIAERKSQQGMDLFKFERHLTS
jgi:hypothetical protein